MSRPGFSLPCSTPGAQYAMPGLRALPQKCMARAASFIRRSSLVLFALTAGASARNGLDLSSDDGFWRLAVRPSLEMTYWHSDEPLPGLLSFQGTDFFQPRLSLGFTAAAGEEWLLHVLTRWDRGFEVGLREDGDFRVDEAFLRWRPLGDGRLNVQAGKFATVFGNWVPRHDFWDDPFLMPPLPYDTQLDANDREGANPTVATVRNRGRKRAWVPVIWGPVYSTGIAISGSSGKWDYAIEVKNAAISSRPDSWSPWEENGSHPSVTGRIGFRPDAAWAVGISASQGTYLRSDAEATIPAGLDRSDYDYTVIGADVRWSHHHLQVFGEVFASRFATATAGDLCSLAYYIEGRWKLNSTVFLAARWAQSWNDDFTLVGPAGFTGYTREVWRATAAAGFRITERVLLKTEYSYNGADLNENTFAVGIGLRF